MLDERKEQARQWFEALRDQITASFEQLETDLPAGAMLTERPPAKFERTPWPRTCHVTGEPGGGGVMSMMSGRVFEKVGVHTSTVFGEFAPEFADACPVFAGRYVRGVTNGPAPQWMQQRLKAIGLRPISTLVDIELADPIDLADPESFNRKKVETAIDDIRGKMGREIITKGRAL